MYEDKQSWIHSHKRLWTSSNVSKGSSALSTFTETSLDHSVDSTEMAPKGVEGCGTGGNCDAPAWMDTRLFMDVFHECISGESANCGLSRVIKQKLTDWLKKTTIGDAPTCMRQLVRALLSIDERLSQALVKGEAPSHAGGSQLSERLRPIVEEILDHVDGADHQRGTSSSALGVNYNPIEDDLYRILLEVEKCEELARSVFCPAEKMSLRQILHLGLGKLLPKRGASQDGERDASDSLSTSKQVVEEIVDILNTSCSNVVSANEAAAHVLQLLKDVEKLKRECNYSNLLLRQYEKTVATRLAAYGDGAPPSVEEERKRLAGAPMFESGNGRVEPTHQPWFAESCQRLVRQLRESALGLAAPPINLAEPLFTPHTTAQQTRADLSVIFASAEEHLSAFQHEYTHARDQVLRLLAMDPATAAADSRHTLSKLIDAHAEKVCTTQREQALLRNAMNQVVERLPLPVQKHFSLGKGRPFDETQTTSLARAIEYLADHNHDVAHRIDALCGKLRQKFALRSLSHSDRTLLEELEFLEDAVAAVCNRSYEATTAESSLQREVEESILELAQLLPLTATDGFGAAAATADSTARLAAPVSNLREMVDLFKRRLLQWQCEQQRQRAANGRRRPEKTHLDEALRGFLSDAQQLLVDALALGARGGSSSTVDPDSVSDFTSHHGPSEANSSSEPDALPLAAPKTGTIEETQRSLSTVLERLRLLKSKHARSLQAGASLASRMDSLTEQASSQARKLKSVCTLADKICSALCIRLDDENIKPSVAKKAWRTGAAARQSFSDRTLSPRSDDARLDPLSLLPRDVSPPVMASPASSLHVNERNILDALRCVEARLKADNKLLQHSALEGEVKRLSNIEGRAAKDRRVFREAIAVMLKRLAENGRCIKLSLFLLGTDESTEDDVLDDILSAPSPDTSCQLEKSDAYAASEGHPNTSGDDNEEERRQHDKNERMLAALLQKYARWTKRLQEGMEDHLSAQQKIAKYFVVVRNFFAAQKTSEARIAALSLDELNLENSIDIDTLLMRFADVILPSLDRAIRSSAAGSPGVSASIGAEKDHKSSDGVLVQLAKEVSATAEGVLPPFDYRLARLHEAIAKMHTVVASLQCVRYLAIPTASKRRSSGEMDLVFEDLEEDQQRFVDLDLEELKRLSAVVSTTAKVPERFSRQAESSSTAPPLFPTASPSNGEAASASLLERVKANDDVILRAAAVNLDVLAQSLRKFGSNHKMAAILVQRDTDAIQQLLASMVKKYSELEVEKDLGQDWGDLREMHVALSARSSRQKSCYFFSRIQGEGSCLCVTALEHLSKGFGAIIDKLVQRTTIASQQRQLLDDIIDLCAMYVGWAEAAATLPSEHALPEDVLAGCVRDNSDASAATRLETPGTQREGGGDEETRASLPPRPTTSPGAALACTPRSAAAAPPPKISHFTQDDLVLRVISHMFQLAQVAVDQRASTPKAAGQLRAHGDSSGQATGEAKGEDASPRIHQLEEQVELLRESVALAEKRVAEAERGRAAAVAECNQAQSEAALARAELRRWGRGAEDGQGGALANCILPADGVPTPTRAAAPPTHSGEQDCLQEILHYMKTLGDELHYAKLMVSRAEEQRAGANSVPAPSPPKSRSPDAPSKSRAGKPRHQARDEVNPLEGFERRLAQQYGMPLRFVAGPEIHSYASDLALQSQTPHRRQRWYGDEARAPCTDSSPCYDRLHKEYRLSTQSHRHDAVCGFSPRGAGGGFVDPHHRGVLRMEHAATCAMGQRSSSHRAQSSVVGGGGRMPRREQPRSGTAAGVAVAARPSSVQARGYNSSVERAALDADEGPFSDATPEQLGRRHEYAWPQSEGSPRYTRQGEKRRGSSPPPPRAHHCQQISPLPTALPPPHASSGNSSPNVLTEALRVIEEKNRTMPWRRPPSQSPRHCSSSSVSRRTKSPISGNANLRAAALKRLEDVVSRTTVRGKMGGQLF